MKIQIFVILILAVMVTISIYSYSPIFAKEVDYCKLVKRLQNQYALEMQPEGYSVESLGGELCTNVKSIYIGLHSEKMLTIDEVRPFYVKGVERLLTRINNDESIRPYLNDYPCDVKNLSYSMSFPWIPVDASGSAPVVHVFCSKDTVCYSVYDPTLIDTNPLRRVYREPYSEALQIVREAGLLTN